MALAATLSLSAQSAREIMVRFDKESKEASYSLIQEMKLSTFKYVVQQGKIRPAEKPRINVLEIVAKDVGIDNKDTRSVSIVMEPTRDKGIGMLTYGYADAGKDDDNWLYLSVLGKVKRLVSTGEGNDEGGSFFGTEFSIEDIASRKIDDYTYTLLGQENYANRPT
ncbi:MAG: outer membrane lipoprotein-sorting protein, partial [Bacteroidales bacterium]|nr:outer membrane lipoprotein-sorting protein [Bacteroidales bacterium]